MENEKIGLIVNEFGAEGIDGKLINQTSGSEMIELNNGSIFCQCIKENFIESLCDFLDYDLSVVFIEASGLSDQSNIKTILETVKKIKGKSYDYLGSICIVDALYFLEQIDLLPVLERQIENSNLVILNKIDLQSLEVLAEIENKILSINRDLNIIRTEYCNFDTQEMLDSFIKLDIDDKESLNTISNRPQTNIIRVGMNSKLENLKGFIDEIVKETYRIKGFVNTDRGNYQVNCVNNTIEINQYEGEVEKYNLVIISKIGIKMISVITNAAHKHNLDIAIV